ncbi:MAG: DUF2180 family protein [Candidatus Lokiarchaeota archaeon]|nr:DUF2180 family protein [Candidatus Lokiarchaeota archaeon]
MKCWFCETEARGTCAFCGRGICKEHAEEGKTKLEASDSFYQNDLFHEKKFYKISNVIKCSACKVKYEKSKL